MINKVYYDDFFIVAESLPDKCIDFMFIDPPYFKIKGEFDFKMSFDEWIVFHQKLVVICYRLLKNNGSLILWGHAKNIAYQQIEFDKYFNLLNSCVWEKNECRTKKNNMEEARCFLPVTERFLFYDKGEDKSGLTMIFSNPDLFESIKKYMRQEKEKIKKDYGFKTEKEFNDFINEKTDTKSVVSRHYFADSQYIFPTKEIYNKLQKIKSPKKEYEYFKKEYEDLRQEYEDLRRYFNLSTKIKYDVILWGQEDHITRNNNHETCKPPGLVREIINICCRKNGVVLEPFAGSAPCRFACAELGMHYIGCENDKEYWNDQNKRFKDFLNTSLLKEVFNITDDIKELVYV